MVCGHHDQDFGFLEIPCLSSVFVCIVLALTKGSSLSSDARFNLYGSLFVINIVYYNGKA